jgi:hypothetical protein
MEVLVHTLAASLPPKSFRYPLDRNLMGSQSRSGRYVKEEGICPLLGIEPRSLGRPACNLIPIPIEPSRSRK